VIEIICECGHEAEWHGLNNFCCYMDGCKCELARETVVARWWARRMMQERDALKHITYITGAPLININHSSWNEDRIREVIEQALSEWIEFNKTRG
jgi:hypothetical protein